MKAYLEWSAFKVEITNKAKLRFNERETFYQLFYGDFECSVLKDSGSDQTDFETNYKSNANKSLESLDADGVQVLRPKAAKAGWTYFMCPIEFTTAKLSSVYCKKHDDTNRAITTYKIYDSNGAEITAVENEGNAVKTVVDVEPTYDYEVIGGQLQQHTKPTTPVRLWVVGVPDVPENSGGTKEMVGGVNLKFIDPTDKVHADGRVSKYMTYNATYHTNKLRLIFRHDAGVQHEVMMVLEMFKA